MPSIRRALKWLLPSALALAFLAWLVTAWPYFSLTTGGEWQAQIVDAGTGAPLEGVVVSLEWSRCYPSPGGWAACGYHDSEEAVTGADGRFALRLRWTCEIPLLVKVSGPEVKIFKGGWGQWRYRGPGDGASSTVSVIELPPLKTRQERIEFFDAPGRLSYLPDGKQPRLKAAHDAERKYLFPR